MKKTAIACAVLAALGLNAQEAGAAAFALAEQGASGLGNAYAGAAAVAEDASTIWWNPAGMARLGSGRHLAAAAFVIAPQTKFSNNGSTVALRANPALTGNGGDAGDTAFLPQVFFAMELNPRWHVGLGINTPFGLKTEYDANWIGRFQGISSEVKTFNFNPSVSYKLSDSASIGGGISYQRGKINLLSGANYAGLAGAAVAAGLAPAALAAAVPVGTEGQNRTKLDGDAWGFNIGALFDVAKATRIGLHYRSSLKYEMDGTTAFSDRPAVFAGTALAARVADGNVRLDFRTPDSLSASVAHSLDSRWQLLGDLTWTHWSRIKVLPVTRSDTGATVGAPLTFNFKDTWRASLGANYKLNNAWTLKAGIAYDQSPVPNANDRPVRLPDSDRYWLSFGAKYQVSRNGALDIGYTFIKAKDAEINNDQTAFVSGIVTGRYDAKVHLFGIQYQHTF